MTHKAGLLLRRENGKMYFIDEELLHSSELAAETFSGTELDQIADTLGDAPVVHGVMNAIYAEDFAQMVTGDRVDDLRPGRARMDGDRIDDLRPGRARMDGNRIDDLRPGRAVMDSVHAMANMSGNGLTANEAFCV